MSNLFKTKWDKADMESADDSKMFPAVLQLPKDDPAVRVPDQHAKQKWPAHVENVKRPRFGHDY